MQDESLAENALEADSLSNNIVNTDDGDNQVNEINTSQQSDSESISSIEQWTAKRKDYEEQLKQVQNWLFQDGILQKQVFQYCKTTTMKNGIVQIQKVIDKQEFDRFTEVQHLFKSIYKLRAQYSNLVKDENAFGKIKQEMERFKELEVAEFNALQAQEAQLDDFFIQFQVKVKECEEQMQIKRNCSNQQLLSEEQTNEIDNIDNEQLLPELKNITNVFQCRINMMHQELQTAKLQVTKLQQKLQSIGGPTGYMGWDKSDQSQFLKLVVQFKRDCDHPKFLSELQSVVPHIQQSNLINHIENYNKYIKCEQELRQQLKTYNGLKQEIAKCMAEQREQNTKETQKKLQSQQIAKQQFKLESVQRWKSEGKGKELETVMDENQALAHQAYLKSKKLSRLQVNQRRQELKSQVEDYKELKQLQQIEQKNKEKLEQLEQMRQKQLRMHNEETLISKQKNKEREQKEIERRVNFVKEKEKRKQKDSEDQIEIIKEAMMKKFQHVKPKLHQATQASCGQVKEKYNAQESQLNKYHGKAINPPDFATKQSHLAKKIPEWRKGLI